MIIISPKLINSKFSAISFSKLIIIIYNNYSNSLSQISNQIQSQDYNNNLKRTLTDLKNSASKLISYRADSVFNTDSYGSSNNNVVKVNNSSGYSGSSVSIDVQQLAQGQVTSTNGISSSGSTLNTTGSLTINKGTESYDINLDLSSCTNDKNALNRIAAKINRANAGVTASVKNTYGTSHLEIVSDDTGEDSQFTLNFSDSLARRITSFNTQESKNAEL